MRQPRQDARALGQRARRHYWLAPRSDDAVGAAVLGQCAAELQQWLLGRCRYGLARSADRLRQCRRFVAKA